MHRIRHTTEKNSRNPKTKATAPTTTPMSSGQPKLRFKLSVEVFLHASSGPTPVRNRISRPTGMFTRLKYGAPTLMRLPVNHSEKTGNRSEEHTSELQSLAYLVCRLLLEKKKIT